MSLAAIIHFKYPYTQPGKDYVLRNDGPIPVLREGVNAKKRYDIKPLQEGETDLLEGVHYRFVDYFGDLEEGRDFDFVDRGPYIDGWFVVDPAGKSIPKPDDQTITIWREEWLRAGEPQPQVPITETEQLRHELIQTQQALSDNSQQLMQAVKEATNAQLALTELYEMVLSIVKEER